MKKKALGQIAAAGALVIPLLIGGGGEAKAAANTTPGCVTIREFKRVVVGQTKKKVEAGIFGARGHLAVRWRTDEGFLAKTYTYKPCTRLYVEGSLVAIDYRWQAPTNRWVVYDGAAVFARLGRLPYTGDV